MNVFIESVERVNDNNYLLNLGTNRGICRIYVYFRDKAFEEVDYRNPDRCFYTEKEMEGINDFVKSKVWFKSIVGLKLYEKKVFLND